MLRELPCSLVHLFPTFQNMPLCYRPGSSSGDCWLCCSACCCRYGLQSCCFLDRRWDKKLPPLSDWQANIAAIQTDTGKRAHTLCCLQRSSKSLRRRASGFWSGPYCCKNSHCNLLSHAMLRPVNPVFYPLRCFTFFFLLERECACTIPQILVFPLLSEKEANQIIQVWQKICNCISMQLVLISHQLWSNFIATS